MVNIEKAKYDAQMESLFEEVNRILGQNVWQTIAAKEAGVKTQDLENKIFRLKNQLEMIGGMGRTHFKGISGNRGALYQLKHPGERLKTGHAGFAQYYGRAGRAH